MDGTGSLYGTTYEDGANGDGNVFKLTPSGDSWTYTSLYDLPMATMGQLRSAALQWDASGNLYGTSIYLGAEDDGVVWEITFP